MLTALDFDQLCRLERINVVGTSGSGKTTLARRIAELLDLPCYEIDQLFWKADWQETPDEELLAKIRDVTSQPRWVLDGNYTRTIPVKWQLVQLIVWLDLPFPLTVFRVTRRAIQRSFSGEEIWPGTGNRETLSKAFLSTDSVILWSIRTHRRNRRQYRELSASADYAHIPFVRLTSPASVGAFLDGLQACQQQRRVESQQI